MRGGSPAQNFPAFVVKMAALYALFADEGMGSAEPARSFRSYRDAFAEYSDDDFMIDEMKMKRLMKRQTHQRFLSFFFAARATTRCRLFRCRCRRFRSRRNVAVGSLGTQESGPHGLITLLGKLQQENTG